MNKWALLLLSAVPLTYVVGFAPGAAAMEPGTLTVAAAEETQTCPVCGYENKAGLNYCTMCGAPLIEETPGEKIYCRQCGAASPEDSKFCTACGYALQVKKPALAPPPKKGVYFTGGLASYGVTMLETEAGRFSGDTGTSWAVGGGFVLSVWSKPGMVLYSLELSTDAGFSVKKKDFDLHFRKFSSRTSVLPIRETAVFGVSVGPGKMIKPFCGFGGGVGIVIWKYKTVVVHEDIFSVGTTVKPLFGIPFGCEFRVTPSFALGVKADYLIILGDIEMDWENEWYEVKANVSVPDLFVFGGTARLGF
ncbi:MAG: zinc ribbon domain-containing protein [bacterium]